ncbi:hypothetical protein PV433_29530 [Paenibacillus sp. GYB004]|uniref:hypothetical protein n=1 Tax=Paenibacillus sp. GYB004 TaxID=2994393 RepID=UPI002F963DA9
MSSIQSYSGIYPHLAVTNGDTEMECGIGAVAAWAGKLWYLTYPPSSPNGSSGDRLYTLNEDMSVEAYPYSVGGTHANRMIHTESKQLIIGPYFIDEKGGVRVIPPDKMKGRLTGVARHLTDPANKVYFFAMESGFYEVDVHSLEVSVFFLDPSPVLSSRPYPYLLPGEHAKGAYTGQGRFVITNNGDGGALAEWNGKGDPGKTESWTIVDRNKYTDVTGPGGICGASDESSPIWSVGWDHKSVLLSLCEGGVWSRYRLPKGSYTHEADNGWYTEWPRIREVGEGKWLMGMFGMLYEFPSHFRKRCAGGLRPLAVHHKMIVDYAEWNGRIVMACNDASRFDNPILGRSQSNLLFTSLDELRLLSKPLGWGGVWVKEHVEANEPSEPFLLAGFEKRVLHVSHNEKYDVTFQLEVDRNGSGTWEQLDVVHVSGQGYAYYIVPDHVQAEWIRLRSNSALREATAYFHYLPSAGKEQDASLVRGITGIGERGPISAGIIRPGSGSDMKLQLAAAVIEDGRVSGTGYYELGPDMKLVKCDRPGDEERLRNDYAPSLDFEIDEASVVCTDKQGNRYRLPKGDELYSQPTACGWTRGVREVVTERSLMNVHGTFYELPRDLSRGFLTIQPICSHDRLIFDYASWRGMLVISGCKLGSGEGGRCVKSEDGQAALWFGNVDDLRKFGAPRGIGGPLRNMPVQPGIASDPYLMAGYVHKTLKLRHDSRHAVQFSLEVDVLADGSWVGYDQIEVPAGTEIVHRFPDGYSAHWVRVKAYSACRADAVFIYE